MSTRDESARWRRARRRLRTKGWESPRRPKKIRRSCARRWDVDGDVDNISGGEEVRYMTRTRLSCDHFLFFDFRSLTFDSLRTPIAALFCDTLSLLYTHFANSFRRTVPRDFPAGHPFYLLLRRPVTLLLSQSHALSITQFIDKTRKQTTKTKTTKQRPQNEAYDYFYNTFYDT